MPNPDPGIPNADARDHATLGLLCLTPLVAAAFLRIDGSDVVLPFVDIALPTVCWSRRWFDISCPGCGLTRGLVSAMHGNFAAAWNHNPAVFLVVGVLAYQVIFRAVQIQRIRTGRGQLRSPIGTWLAWASLAAMLVQWTMRR